MVSATGGERSPVNERTSARKKRIFARAGITERKSMRAEANVSNCESARNRGIHLHFCRDSAAAIIFLPLAAEAREPQAFSLAEAKPAAPWTADLLEHSERRELGESLVQRKLRR